MIRKLVLRPFATACILAVALIGTAAEAAPGYQTTRIHLRGGGVLQAPARLASDEGSFVLKFPEGRVRVSKRCVRKVERIEAGAEEGSAEREKSFLAARRTDKGLKAFCSQLPESEASAYLVRCLLAEDDGKVRSTGSHEIRSRKARWIFELVAFGASSEASSLSGARRLRSSTSWRRRVRCESGDLSAGFRITSAKLAQLAFAEGELRLPHDRIIGLGARSSRVPLKPKDLVATEKLPAAKPWTALPSPGALASGVKSAKSGSAKANALLLRGFLAGGAHRKAVLPLLAAPERRWIVGLIARWGKRPREAAVAAGKLRRAWAEERWQSGLVTLTGKGRGDLLACEFFQRDGAEELEVRFGKARLTLHKSDFSKVLPAKDRPDLSFPEGFDADQLSDWISSGRKPEGLARLLVGLLSTKSKIRLSAAEEIVDRNKSSLFLLVLKRSESLDAVTLSARGLLTLQSQGGQKFKQVFTRLMSRSDRWRARVGMQALAGSGSDSARDWAASLKDSPTRQAMLWLTLGDDDRVHREITRLASKGSTSRLSRLLRLVGSARRPFPAQTAVSILRKHKSYAVRNAALEAISVSMDPTVIPDLTEVLEILIAKRSKRSRGLARRVESALRSLSHTRLSGLEAWDDWVFERGEFLDSLLEDTETLLDGSLSLPERLTALSRLKRTQAGASVEAYSEVLGDSEEPLTLIQAVAQVLSGLGVRRAWATRSLVGLLADPETSLVGRSALRRIYKVDHASIEDWEGVVDQYRFAPPLRVLRP
ncbi:MAG: hypothetical protein JKY65_31935 [Planctomycetes bacterium]|nr:hypothetical protein [Planctomycetota bacterium]